MHQVDSFGNVYKGELLGGRRHGTGTIVYASTRDVYQGDFENDLPHGTGRFCKASEKDYVFEGLCDFSTYITVQFTYSLILLSYTFFKVALLGCF